MARNKPLLLRAAVSQENGSLIQKTVRFDEIVADWTPRSILTHDVRARLFKVYDRIGHMVTKVPRTDWVESFNVNAHPEREVAVWEAIVKAWESLNGTEMSASKSFTTIHVLISVSLYMIDIANHLRVSDEFVEQCRRAYAAAMRS